MNAATRLLLTLGLVPSILAFIFKAVSSVLEHRALAALSSGFLVIFFGLVLFILWRKNFEQDDAQSTEGKAQ